MPAGTQPDPGGRARAAALFRAFFPVPLAKRRVLHYNQKNEMNPEAARSGPGRRRQMIKNKIKQLIAWLVSLRALFKRVSNEAPDNAVRHYVESFFAPIRYSSEIGQAKTAAIAALEPIYEALKREDPKGAFQTLVARYPDLESLAEAAGLDRARAELWRQNSADRSWERFLAFFRRRRFRMWILNAVLLFAAGNIALSLLSLRGTDVLRIVFNAGLALLVLVLGLRLRAGLQEDDSDVDRFEEMERLFDRYARKSINWMSALFAVFFFFVFELVKLGVNSRSSELVDRLAVCLPILTVLSLFFVKNLLLIRWLLKNVEFERGAAWRREFRRVLVLSAVYWLLSLGVYFVFEYYLAKNIAFVFYGGCLLSLLAFNLFRLRHFCYSRLTLTKPAVILILLALLGAGGLMYMRRNVWLTQPYINSVANVYEAANEIVYEEQTGVFTITNDDESDFKILQLTDIHLGGSLISYDKDLKALQACCRLIEHTRPDLVIVTGDLCYPIGIQSFSFNNDAPIQQFAAFMRNTGVPWAFTYGNHDTESVALVDENGLDERFRSLSWHTSKNLLYPYVQPEITGRSNQLIELRNADGSLNQALFLIDSNAYTGEGLNKYDYIHDDQVAWYRENVLRLNAEEGKTVSSMCFIHIPLQEYRTAYELYLAGSGEVKYFFGSNDEKGEKKVYCSDYPSTIFQTALELGSTTAFFCGHDHYNNLSLEYQGIRLTYGMSIDYYVSLGIARDTKQRGATLITCHPDSSYDVEQVPLIAIEGEGG